MLINFKESIDASKNKSCSPFANKLKVDVHDLISRGDTLGEDNNNNLVQHRPRQC